MKNINIWGSGLFGVLLASSVRHKLDLKHIDNVDVNLFDKSDSILGSWRSINIKGHLVNPGFHALELPRAEKTKFHLDLLLNRESYVQIHNIKALLINNFNIPFRAPIIDWPRELSQDLNTVELSKAKNTGDNGLLEAILADSNLGRIMLSISSRYASSIQDCYHLIYPWFFPYECSFSSEEEGSVNQRLVYSGKSKTRYLIPESGLFGSLIPEISTSLLQKNIKIHLNQHLNLQSVNHAIEDLNIWSGSSSALLSLLKSKSNETNKHSPPKLSLHLFSYQSEYLNSLYQASCLPSEYLCANSEIPEMSRISFPELGACISMSSSFVLVECYHSQSDLPADVISSVECYLCCMFDGKFAFVGSSKSRPLSIFNPNLENESNKELDALLQGINLSVPYRFWWPVNMSKAGLNIDSCADSIVNSIVFDS